MKAEPHSQSLPQINASLPSDSGEGGLDFGQVIAAIRRQVLLIVGMTTVVASAALFKALTDTPTYQARFEILTQPITVEAQVISSVPQTLTSETASQLAFDDTKLRVLSSPRIIDPIVEQLRSQYPGITYGSLVSNLGISALGKNTNILAVTYRSSDPEQVKVVLEALYKAYLEYSLESRQSDIRRGIVFVEDQLPDLQERVEEFQTELQRLRQRYSLVNPASRGQELTSQISTFRQQQLDTQARLAETRALYLDLQQQLATRPTETPVSSALAADTRYQTLLSQLLTIDSEIAAQSALFEDASPEMQVLQEQRANLSPLLNREGQRVQQEIASRIRELEARNLALLQTLDRLNQGVDQLSSIDRQYTDIERELQIATNNLNQFLAKREALRIDAAQRETPWELLTPPGNPHPSSASIKRNLVLGTLLGLLLGVGAALALDKMNTLLYTAKDVKRVAKLPILGTIPFYDDVEQLFSSGNVPTPQAIDLLREVKQYQLKGSPLPTNKNSYNQESASFLEAFRSLNASIRLINPDIPIRSLVISSAMPGDGKSTVASCLAHAAAVMGKRVLLIDTDLRHPQIYQRLGLTNSEGLSDVIAETLDLKAAIKQSPLESNLFILTAGSVAPDPTKALASKHMEEIMKQASETFDLVLYDAPPLLGLADPYLIATHTNGLLLVVGLGKLKRYWLEQAVEQLEISNTPVLGVVANGSKEQHVHPYGHYYQHYGQPSPEQAASQEEVGGLKSRFTTAFPKRLF